MVKGIPDANAFEKRIENNGEQNGLHVCAGPIEFRAGEEDPTRVLLFW
jgi:hypothetical protein